MPDDPRPHRAIFHFLDDVGDSTGVSDMVGDFAVENKTFIFRATSFCQITRMVFYLRDSGQVRAQDYGAIAGGLLNGYLILVRDETGKIIKDLTGGVPITNNAGWGRYCFDVERKAWGSGDIMIMARWELTRTGRPLTFFPGYSLTITLEDDTSSLLEHCLMIQGNYLAGP